MKINKYDATVAEVFDIDTGKVYAVVKKAIGKKIVKYEIVFNPTTKPIGLLSSFLINKT